MYDIQNFTNIYASTEIHNRLGVHANHFAYKKIAFPA